MAVRTDVTIDWESSPRVITVLAPSTEITIQDLVDTCRYNEEKPLNMDDPHLIDAAGKEPLGGSVYVGITATLQNAVLAFEARLGPTWTLCKISGGNLVAEDADGNEIDPRLPTAYTTIDRTASSSATLLEEEALQYSSFAGCVTVDKNSSYAGTDFPIGTLQQPVNNFTDAKTIADDRGFNCFLFIDDITIESSDNIRGFNCEGTYHDRLTVTFESGCNVSGTQFNRVKLVGDVGNEFTVFHDRSSLGNISNLDANVYDSELSGTIVLNLDSHRHWTNCYCNQITNHPTLDFNNTTQELVMTGYQGGLNVKNFVSGSKLVIYGEALEITLQSTCVGGDIIIIGTGKVVDNSGVLCTVNDAYLVSQYIIESTITTSETNIRGADSDTLKTISDQIDTLEFSATSSGVAGAVWDQLISSHTISGTFGRLIQDIDTTVNTITADVSTATVSGIAQAVWNELVAFHTISGTFGQYIQDIYYNTENITITGSVNVNPASIADAVWDEPLGGHSTKGSAGATQQCQLYQGQISIDVANGEAGTSWPIGTHRYPVNNIDDALTIAVARNIDMFLLHGPLTIEAGDVVDGYSFNGHEGWGPQITFEAGCSTNETAYKYIELNGELTAGDVLLIESCTITNELLNFSGVMNVVDFEQGLELSIDSWANIIEASAGGEPTNEPEITLNGAQVTITKYSGNIKLKGKTDNVRTTVELAGGTLLIDSTCVSGTIQVLGHGHIESDDSGPNCTVDTDGFLSRETVSFSVWEELVDDHGTADTTGKKLKDLGSSVILTGTATGSGIGGNQITLDSFASTTDGAYDPAMISIVDGTGSGQTRGIYQYDGATRTATVDRGWKTLPDNTSEYVISAWPGREHVNEGLAQGGTSNTITLNVLASSTNDAYNGQTVFIRSGTGEDQVATVIAYDGSTKIATVSTDWQIIPDYTSAYVMLPIKYLTRAMTADAIWEELKSGHTTSGTFGKAIQDMEADLTTLSGLAPANEYDAALAAIQADLNNPDQYKADVSALALEATLQDVKTTVDALPTASGIWTYEDRTLTTISGIEVHGVSDWSDAEKSQIRYALGITGAKVATSSGQLEALIKQNRQYNISLEEVRATVDIAARNVEAGQVDYIIFKIKNDEDVDWSTPIASGLLYAWYRDLGDTSPQYMKENS